ncbi:(2Fe-2S) ferredoxin domain-containing protein [Pseudobacteriovorax antillogorgiicola]|nr:(2Fe-2S) ferredoxin domain-containing protein [Pseudobacteriovorax antillogorgiicola]
MLETKFQALGHVIICQGCCCGQVKDGNPEVPLTYLRKEWIKHRLFRWFHLSISECLGPCDLPNVISITTNNQNWYFGKLQVHDYHLLVSWLVSCKKTGQLKPLPSSLMELSMKRFRSLD